MKKCLLILITILFLIPITTNAKSNYLYDVFEQEAENGTLVHEYTGEHHDSFTREPSKKIYHWYSSDSATSATIREKNNVLFNNMCWQMIRTTDTGGVKLLYNGKAVDNKCGSSRTTNSLMFSRGDAYVRLGGYNSYYSDTFEYDSSTNKFSLTGDTIQYSWSNTDYEQVIGKWTCQTSQTSCDRLYYVHGYSDDYYGWVFRLYNDSTLQNGTIGQESFSNYNSNNSGELNLKGGWKTNSHLYKNHNNKSTSESPIAIYNTSTSSSLYFYYSDSFTYNNRRYKLSNGATASSLGGLESVVGKYTIFSRYDFESSTNMGYIIGITNDNKLIYVSILNGDSFNEANYSYMYGSDYTINNDGTYTITNATKFNRKDYANHYSNLANKYICIETSTNKCDSIRYVSSAYSTYYNYKDSSKYLFSPSVTYSGGKYTLSSTDSKVVTLSDNAEAISNSGYYTCFNYNGECSKVAYVVFTYGTLAIYIEYENGETYVEEENTVDSRMKKALDLWYKIEMEDYSDYLEETVFCENKEIVEIYPSSNTIKYGNYDTLGCSRDIDRYSVDNDNAKLDYSIGLITYPELNIMNNFDAFRTSANYFTMTPNSANLETSYYVVTDITSSYYSNTPITYNSMSSAYYVRPVVSLNKYMAIESGDGSTNNPYVLYLNNKHSIDVEIVNETEDINIELNDLTTVEVGEEVNFRIKPIYGYQVNSIIIKRNNDEVIEYQETDNPNEYTFTMPDSNVTITPVYERKKSQVISKNSQISPKEFAIEVANASAVVYEDNVKFTVIPNDGFEVSYIDIIDEEENKLDYEKTELPNEYQFRMPGTDVTITPYFKEAELTNPKTGPTLILIVLVFLSMIGSLYCCRNILHLKEIKKQLYQ